MNWWYLRYWFLMVSSLVNSFQRLCHDQCHAWGVGARVLIYSPGIALTFLVRLGCWLSSHSCSTPSCVPFFPTSIIQYIYYYYGLNFALNFWSFQMFPVNGRAEVWCSKDLLGSWWQCFDANIGLIEAMNLQSYSENAWLAGLGGLGHLCFSKQAGWYTMGAGTAA